VSSVADYYDGLAADDHLANDGWSEAVRRHGQSLAKVLSKDGITRRHALDLACGIPVQTNFNVTLEG
jgi:hypothetical protein